MSENVIPFVSNEAVKAAQDELRDSTGYEVPPDLMRSVLAKAFAAQRNPPTKDTP